MIRRISGLGMAALFLGLVYATVWGPSYEAMVGSAVLAPPSRGLELLPAPGVQVLELPLPGSDPVDAILSPSFGVNQAPLWLGMRSLPATIPELESLVQEYARCFGVDENLVWAVMRQESGFNPGAVSPKGAMGLMQLMPGTAALMGVADPFDPAQNIAGGIKYLKECLARFHQDVTLALAAYNAGPENVAKYGGCPPFAETRNYVASVLQDYARRPPRPEPPAAAAAHPGGLVWRTPLPQCQMPTPQIRIAPPQAKIPLKPRWVKRDSPLVCQKP
ncbi:MAG: lytic transglycosylase domain-containing protein [Deltaproteobacteria bacterium]|nr:lytic transglycosylase domain-containing protein [Deltaproteobacteria bacterium]